MSQTETLLLVVLGFALATLIALFVGRLLWAAALKLGARRMQKQVPTTLVGLQTERDRLRAEYAMLSQRLGSRLEAAKLKMAEQMAEVSRHRNRLELLESEKQSHAATIAGLKAQIDDLNEQLGTARTEQSEMQQTIADKQAALEQAHRDLAAELRHPALLAETPSASTEEDPERRLRSRIERLNELAQTVAHDRGGPHDPGFALPSLPLPAPEPPTDPLIIAKLEDAEQQTGDLQKELEKLDAEWSKRLSEMQDQAGLNGETAPPPTAVANVISLANRIRDLKKGIGAS